MAKCYVIKNKEGKYISKYTHYDYSNKDYYKHICTTTYIRNAQLFKKPLECVDDLKCIEVTLCEGDLEKELQVYKKAFELACESNAVHFEKRNSDLFNDTNNYLYKHFLVQSRKELEENNER